ncbi:hypothetical protein BAUCODRAFT_107453 [Baudoinia panamericana UAMH 10762]|uniref:Uncharacterized protein n=1 Tax=Baudoinia panamericana (strain UAMH 10762) TaxID=717646 RepID=M2NEN8_BAUPA|nr:uncharacterized protein BAUCODRAFT_107453 [Baudoinia panamericana UAMH 10762]EMC97714.1 hypothetical protein BAUCODRAFT_107453 [Baudoinia panamericana UAMH 10762]
MGQCCCSSVEFRLHFQTSIQLHATHLSKTAAWGNVQSKNTRGISQKGPADHYFKGRPRSSSMIYAPQSPSRHILRQLYSTTPGTMDSEKTQQTPPPYGTTGQPDEAEQLLRRIEHNINEFDAGTFTDSALKESRRLANLLTFMLAVDYQRNTKAALTAEDRDHYATISGCLDKLRTAHDHTLLTASERSTLAPFFWKYLHEPCQVLALPVECAIRAIQSFFKYTSYNGQYKGSVYGVLHDRGLDGLAYKLYMDRSVVIPRTICEPTSQEDLLRGNAAVGSIYFTGISGIECSTSRSDSYSGWSVQYTISYTLNKRGTAYKVCRCGATTTVENSVGLSPSHWAHRIKALTNHLLMRKEISAHDKKMSDLRQWPLGWKLLTATRSTHLPDFFEQRARKDCCEM